MSKKWSFQPCKVTCPNKTRCQFKASCSNDGNRICRIPSCDKNIRGSHWTCIGVCGNPKCRFAICARCIGQFQKG